MTEQEFKEAMQREFGVETVDALWDKLMESPEVRREELLSFIETLPVAMLQGFVLMARVMARRMANK